MDPSSFSIEFQQGKEDGVGGFVVVCEWTGGAGAEKEEEKIGPGLLERGRFKYFARGVSGSAAGWRGEEEGGRNPMGECAALCGRSRRGQLAAARQGTGPQHGRSSRRLFTRCGAMSCLLRPELA
jgi:hypothetical protein